MARSKATSGNWADLEVFEDTGARVGAACVSIHSNGVVSLNRAFVRQAQDQMQERGYVRLHYSKENSAMALDFTDDDRIKGVIKVSGKGSAGASFAARSFFNFYQIEPAKAAGRYTPELTAIPGKGSLWVVYLGKAKAGPLAKRRRTKTK